MFDFIQKNKSITYKKDGKEVKGYIKQFYIVNLENGKKFEVKPLHYEDKNKRIHDNSKELSAIAKLIKEDK